MLLLITVYLHVWLSFMVFPLITQLYLFWQVCAFWLGDVYDSQFFTIKREKLRPQEGSCGALLCANALRHPVYSNPIMVPFVGR